MAVQVPILAIAAIVKILGPKAVRAAKSLHKRLVAQKKTKMSQQEFLSNKARTQMRVNKSDAVKKRIESGPKQSKQYKGKRDPSEKKAEPPSIKTKDSQGKMTTSPKKKDTSTIVPVFDKATRKYKNFDVSKITEKELYSIKPRSSQLISKWVQYHKGIPSKGIPPLKDATKQAVKKLKEKMKNK